MAARILVIEDDVVLCHAYELILKKEGHDVEVASNGQEGIEKAEAFDPHIILLDLLMPVMDGIEFLETFDAKTNHPSVKIIILSNLGDDEKVKKALELGAYKYIVKAHASQVQLAHVINHLITTDIEKKPKP